VLAGRSRRQKPGRYLLPADELDKPLVQSSERWHVVARLEL